MPIEIGINYTFTGAEIGKFYVITLYEYILGFDIAMEDALAVDVLDSFQ